MLAYPFIQGLGNTTDLGGNGFKGLIGVRLQRINRGQTPINFMSLLFQELLAPVFVGLEV